MLKGKLKKPHPNSREVIIINVIHFSLLKWSSHPPLNLPDENSGTSTRYQMRGFELEAFIVL